MLLKDAALVIVGFLAMAMMNKWVRLALILIACYLAVVASGAILEYKWARIDALLRV